MISKIVIDNYQSIAHAAVELGMFTVVTGPTGSGKSGLIRAVKLPVFNQRGTSFVRHGESTCMVQLGLLELEEKDGFAVAIRRGKGKDAYVLAPPGDGPHETSTKLAGTVPDNVPRLLRLSTLNFAGQFDSPFLLTDSAGEVARRLGELTKVTLVFEAAREANRRRLAIAGDLRRAEEQLAALGKQAQQYRSLKAQREALTAAEQALQEAVTARTRTVRLKALTVAYAKAEEDVSSAEAAVRLAAPPDLEPVITAQQKHTRLKSLIAVLDVAQAQAEHCDSQARTASDEVLAAHAAMHEELVTAGTCPTCGQKVTVLGQLAVQLYGDRAS